MAVTRAWKVYGIYGYAQRESYNKSIVYNFSEGENIRVIEVMNSDKTGTNEYTIVQITRDTSDKCWSEFIGQLTDGIFENTKTGQFVEITGN